MCTCFIFLKGILSDISSQDNARTLWELCTQLGSAAALWVAAVRVAPRSARTEAFGEPDFLTVSNFLPRERRSIQLQWRI